jgi:hypothetical protein
MKNLDLEMKQYYTVRLSKKIRKDLIPGNSKSLWRTVGIAKNLYNNDIPESMYHKGQ